MSTTIMPAAAPYISVPPTFDTLDPFQRARLMQTTKKLGRVLGTTPIVRDVSTSPSERVLLPIGPRSSSSSSRSASPSPVRKSATPKAKRSRRQGSLFEIPLLQNPAASQSSSSLSSIASQSSTTSLPDSRSFAANRRRNFDMPSPLHLTTFMNTCTSTAAVRAPSRADATSARLGMAPDALVRTHRRARSSSAASTSLDVGVVTPLTPSFRLRAAANPAHRREVLHKLERTLGEPVPPSLVFPADALARAAAAAADRDRLRPPSPDVQLRSPSLDLPRETHYIAGPVRRASSTLSVSTRTMRRRSTSINDTQARPAQNPRGSSHWQPPKEWTIEPTECTTQRADSGDVELLGIWNAENYDSVMLRLRSLRV